MAEGTEVRVIDGGGPPPPPDGARDATRSAARAASMASLADELGALDGSAPAPEPPAEKPAAKEPDPDPEEKPAEEPAGEPEEEDDDESDAKAAKAEEAKEEEKPDKDLQRRLSAVQREEKRAKAALAEERKAIADERRAVERERDEARAELNAFRKVQERARYDLPGVLRALGYKDDDFETAAREVYEASPKGQADPRLKGQAARSAKEREYDDRLARMERQNQELIAQLQQRELAQRAEAWIDQAAKAASEETPLVQRMLERSPTRARAELKRVADRLIDETGEVPDHEDVVAELEKDLDELGLVAAEKSAPSKTQTLPPAAKTKPAKALGSDLRTSSVQPRSQPMSRDERRRADMEQLAADMAAGRLDA